MKSLLLITSLLLISSDIVACEFGCRPYVDCMPCEGGWCYINNSK